MKLTGVLAALAASLTLAGCGADSATTAATGAAGQGSACPKQWRAGWQRLANDVGSAVYCPGWMPYPLDGKIDGRYKNGRWVDEKDNSYLVSFLWLDQDAGVSREVHVNLRGYPGRTTVPMCESQTTTKGKTVRKAIPCFADKRETRRIGSVNATVYTVNQGIDAWHVLYTWPREGSLYTVSEHVVSPYAYKDVVRNLDRVVRRLVLVEPTA